jgi:hypothetical protein
MYSTVAQYRQSDRGQEGSPTLSKGLGHLAGCTRRPFTLNKEALPTAVMLGRQLACNARRQVICQHAMP